MTAKGITKYEERKRRNRVLQKKLNFTGSRYHNAPQLQNPVDMGRTVCLEARGKHQSITSHQVE